LARGDFKQEQGIPLLAFQSFENCELNHPKTSEAYRKYSPSIRNVRYFVYGLDYGRACGRCRRIQDKEIDDAFAEKASSDTSIAANGSSRKTRIDMGARIHFSAVTYSFK
jgi:hypothetical protein